MIEETLNGAAEGGIPSPAPQVQNGEQGHIKMMQLSYNVFNTPDGKDLLNRLLEKHVFTLPFQPGAPDGYAEFRAGQNDVILMFRKAVELGEAGKLGQKEGTNNK